MTHQGLSSETLAAHACGESDPTTGALVPPIHPSTIYEANPDGTPHEGIAYTRADNPTYDHAERRLAEFGLAWGLDVEFVDTSDVVAVRRAIRPGRTRLLWLETPANPTWDVVDLAAMAEIAHEANARVAVDNTVATPVLTGPIEFGADLVAVVGATDHSAGTAPFFAPGKR